MTLSLTSANSVYSGSFIGVSFPQYLTAVVGNTCSTNNSLISCSVTSNNFSNLSVSGTVAASETIVITYNSITNAQEALTANSVSVTSYIDSANDGIIDQLSTGLTLSFTANQLPSNVFYILPANKTTFVTTSYTFSVVLSDPIPANGYIVITFPSSVTLTSPSLLSASFSTTNYSLSQSGSNLTILNCFSSGLNTLTVSMSIGGINNPSSMAPSASFQIFTFGSIAGVNYLNSGPSVTMTSIAQSAAFSALPTSTTVHATTTYTFSITFFGAHTSNDYLIFSIPSTMSFAANPVCSPVSGIASINCTLTNSSLKIVLVAVPSSTITFNVSNINNYDVSNTAVTLSMTAYNTAGYAS